jgi:hypothetical protein
MKSALSLLLVSLFSLACFSQDVKLREEAVALMERTDTLRVFGAQGMQCGTFREMSGPGLRCAIAPVFVVKRTWSPPTGQVIQNSTWPQIA